DMIKYADDTYLVIQTTTDFSGSQEIIMMEVDNVQKWASINYMTVNISKSAIMKMGHYKNTLVDNSNTVTLSMESVTSMKMLGVIIDHMLCWNLQIKRIQVKISKRLYILR